jgi:hypothetical protein
VHRTRCGEPSFAFGNALFPHYSFAVDLVGLLLEFFSDHALTMRQIDFGDDYRRDLVVTPPESCSGEIAWRISNRLTHLIAIAKGHSFPLILVAEHPRSGGTWLCDMLSDYFQIPFPKYSRLPLACPAVVHTHLWYSSRLTRAIFVARDGRDLVVSSYFSTLLHRERLLATGLTRHRHVRSYASLDGATTDPQDCRRRLPQFIREWWSSPVGCRANWAEYTASWTTNPSVIVTRFELLLGDCNLEMTRIVESLSSKPADRDRLRSTIQKFSFVSQTGREPGQPLPSSNKRMGQVGGWRDFFTYEAATTFQRLAGQMLVKLDYERDNNWVRQCPHSG